MTINVAPETKMPYWWAVAVLAMVVFVAGFASTHYLPDWMFFAPATGVALGLLLGAFNKLEMWRTFDGTRSHISDSTGCYFPLGALFLSSLVMGFACHNVRGGIAFFVGMAVCWLLVMLIKPVPTDTY